MRRHKGLSIKEIISLCVLEEIEESKICRTVPPPSKDAVYVLDLSEIDIKDITCDDAGIYDCHSSPSTIVKANIEGKEILNITTLSRRKVDINETCFQESDIYKVKRMYSEKKENNSKASRIVSRVYRKEKHARYATVQYIGDRICSLRPHKNSKSKDAYLRTKPSVIRKEKDLAAEVAPKQVINRIDSNNNNLNYSSASDGPRDRQQIYNVKKKMNSKFKARNTGKLINPDFGKLVASMDNGDFLKDIDFSYRHKFNRIHPNTFAATDNSLTWLKTFCSTNSEFKSQLGIDMTYKIGPFYTTCLSFPHPIFVHKNDRQKHPTVFVGMMTSTGRQTEDYMYMANQLKSRGISNLIYGTDGEYALELGMESVFPIDGVSPDKRSVKLRCFNHLTDNLDMELKKYDVNRNEIIASILGQEYENKRISGLVDCSTLDFDREYRKLSVNWPQEFINYLEAKELKVRSIKDTLKKCMSQDIRKAAGLGNPPNKYDNQRAESMNSVLKEAIGEHYVDQAAVHDYVNENLMKPQEKELVKAIYCHGEYRLSQRFKHLEIAPLEWKTMSDDQKTNHVNKILRCKVAIGNDTPVITKKLSVQPQDCDHCLNDMPLGLINDLWNSAEIMLSVAHIITLANGNHCITYENDFFLITEKNLDFHCKCERFGKLQLCSHVMIIADQRNALESLLSKFRYNPSHAIYKHKPISAGEKRVSKPRKGVQNVKKKAIYVPVETNIIPDDHIDLRIQRPYQFNEIWQNDEPFELLKVKDLKQPENQSLHCVSCKNVISRRNAIPPYDIVFCHKERYKYPSRETNGNVVWKETEKRMANKYYCIKKTCLLGRHPYFWNGLINSDKISLKEEHVRLLQRELDFQV